MLNVNRLFSREALDKMRSPEKLDVLLHITNPIGWMALVAVLLLLFGVVMWSIFGAFTVKANGYGLIMDAGGVSRYVAKTTGTIEELYVVNGQQVSKGQVIGRLAQNGSGIELDAIRQGIALGSNQSEVAQRVNDYDTKRNMVKDAESLISPCNGTVDDLAVYVGKFINMGEDICIIRQDEGRTDLTGVMYVPVSMGKRVETGMSVQLSPNGTDSTQSGSLLGIVRGVSQYPVSQSEMLNRLGNSQLVQSILQSCQEAVVEVTFDLVKNQEDKSGYLWTSVVGDHKPITAGTYVTGFVVVDRKPPIEKVFYKASQWLRSR